MCQEKVFDFFKKKKSYLALTLYIKNKNKNKHILASFAYGSPFVPDGESQTFRQTSRIIKTIPLLSKT